MQLFKNSLKKHTDEELMQKAAAGHSRAFDELYTRYATRLTGYFHRMLWKNKPLAEDCLHRLFMKIIEKPELFDTGRNFKTWVYSVAHNICKNEYRKMERTPTPDMPLQKVAGNEAAIAPSAIDAVDYKRFANALENELLKMSENHRQTFELRFYEQLSIKEIAEIMECSEGTVKSRIFYTIKNLSAQLKTYKNLLKY